MLALDFLTDFRDIIIIVLGIAGLVTLAVLLFFTVVIGFSLWRFIGVLRKTLETGVGPIFDNAQETARSVRGAAEFMTDTVAAPFIRVYGTVAGLRHGLGFVARAAGRRNGS